MTSLSADIGKLILRFACGGLLIPHGFHKAFIDIDPIKGIVENAGWPAFLAYGSIVGELIAPLFVVLGFKARLASLIVAFNMLMSIVIAHRDIAFRLNDYGGWMIELNVIYMLTALAVYSLGSGKISISKGEGKWD